MMILLYSPQERYIFAVDIPVTRPNLLFLHTSPSPQPRHLDTVSPSSPPLQVIHTEPVQMSTITRYEALVASLLTENLNRDRPV
jgi:hypothetical protein